MTAIERFGWRGPVAPGIARIVSAHGDYFHLVANEAEGEILARRKKSVFARAGKPPPVQPITGDFVRFRYNAQGESMITEVLPRFSHFERRDPTAHRQVQTLAVNFDTLFVMMSLNENFSTARLERYLALAADMGEAEAVLVLTKADLLAERPELREEIDAALAAFDCPRVFISALTGEGVAELESRYFLPGRTVAFIGSSGVGKSTLVNRLAGEEWQAVQEIQAWSGKGRHTTTSRELIPLAGGAMVIDTPGIREIGAIGERDVRLERGSSTHRYRPE